MSKEKNDKKYKYLVTMRWYVETNEELVAALRNASVKDSLRAKLNFMEQDKTNK